MSTEHPSPVLAERDFLNIRLTALGLAELGQAPRKSYRLIYKICLHNESSSSVCIRGRKWMMRDQAGQNRIVEAAGIFNQQPVLAAGGVYCFSGQHEFKGAEPAQIELRLFGTDQQMIPFISPAFRLPLPKRK